MNKKQQTTALVASDNRCRYLTDAGVLRRGGLIHAEWLTEHVSGARAVKKPLAYFCNPLNAPFPLLDLPFYAQLRSTRFSARSAPFSAPLTLRSRSAHAPLTCSSR